MMAQYVGRSRFAPATILLFFVPVYVVQLANAGVPTSIPLTTTATDVMIVADAVRHDDVLPRVVQLTVNSVTIISELALPFGANSADDRQVPHVEFLGTGLDRDLELRWSLSSRDCPHNVNNTLDAVWTSSTGTRAIYRFRTVPDAKITIVYFCLRDSSDEKWNNLGNRISIKYLERPE